MGEVGESRYLYIGVTVDFSVFRDEVLSESSKEPEFRDWFNALPDSGKELVLEVSKMFFNAGAEQAMKQLSESVNKTFADLRSNAITGIKGQA